MTYLTQTRASPSRRSRYGVVLTPTVVNQDHTDLVAAIHITQSDNTKTPLSIHSGEKHTSGDIQGCSVLGKALKTPSLLEAYTALK